MIGSNRQVSNAPFQQTNDIPKNPAKSADFLSIGSSAGWDGKKVSE